MRTHTEYSEFESLSSTDANPFPGLRSFDIWENHLFFGREGQIDALLWKLAKNHFVSVVGASGSGKSSLMRAGLLPVLMGGFQGMAGTAWRIAVLRPGIDPIRNLASALNAEDVFGTGDADEDARRTDVAEATLHSSSLGLVQLVRQARMAADENLLVVVDQFEELFRFKENERIEGAADQASAFVRLLLECVMQREAPIYVALTLRSDFLGDCSQFRDLPEAINEGQYLIPRLRREQIRAAIVGPVAVGGGKIAPRLTQRLLNDVGDNPDQLPILQHALMRTWDQWVADHQEGEPIDLRHYEAIGGMRKALSQHADEAYNDLPDDNSRHLCETMFKALTERGQDNRGIRRPTRLSEICAIADAPADQVVPVVDLFRRPGRTFIMPPHNVDLTADSVLDISHESLMRVWERLEKWVDEDAQSAQIYNRIVGSALLYEEGLAGLWHDPDLQIAEEWRAREKPTEPWAARYDPAFASAMRFLDRSIQLRSDEQRERRRRRRVAQVIAVAFLACAGVLSVWALKERSNAEDNYATALAQGAIATKQRAEAERQRNRAEQSRLVAEHQRQLADTQRTEAVRQRTLADQQKREALAQRQRAEAARQDALSSRDAAEAQRRAAVEQRQIAESERARAVSLADSISRSRLLSIAQGLARTVQLGKVGQEDLNALLALQAYDFNRTNGGYDRDPDVYGALFSAAKQIGTPAERVLVGHRDAVRAIAFSPDGGTLISGGSDGLVIAWRLRSPGMSHRILAEHDCTIRSVVFDQAGRRLVYAGTSGTVFLIDNLDDPRPRPLAVGVDDAIFQLLWLDDHRLAVLGSSATIRMLDPRTGQVGASPSSSGQIKVMGASRDGKTLVAGSAGGVVFQWKGGDFAATPTRITAGSRSVVSLAVSNDGSQAASANDAGEIRVWDMNNPTSVRAVLRGHRSAVNALAFGDEGRILVSAGSDGTARMWDLRRPAAEPTLVHEHTSWIWTLAIDPSGKTIATGGNDRAVRLQPTAADLLARPLERHVTRNMSRSEWAQYIGADIAYQKTVPSLKEGD